jgi:hypothetical protein
VRKGFTLVLLDGGLAAFSKCADEDSWRKSVTPAPNATPTAATATISVRVRNRGGRTAAAPSSRGVPTHPQRPMMYREMHGMMKNIQIPIL